jgi:4-hydroxybenzoate polyprenyltransferase
LLTAAGFLTGASVIYFTAIAGAALHSAWQISRLDIDDPNRCLQLFRSNRDLGLIVFFGALLDSLFRVMP